MVVVMERIYAVVLEDIKDHPENHIHNMDALMACSMINGAIDSGLLDAHSKYVDLGSNGGIRCDVIDGACACGSWHDLDEARVAEIKKFNQLKSKSGT